MEVPHIARRYWARKLIDKARGQEIPPYGSLEWNALPEGDARKVAAVVVAAEAWAQMGDELEETLRREVEELRRAFKADEDADYVAGMAAHREQWQPVTRSTVVPFAARRRRDLEACAPRPDDRRGGEVSTW